MDWNRAIDHRTYTGEIPAVIAVPKCLKTHAEELRKIRQNRRQISSVEARKQCERVEKASARNAGR